MRPGMLLTLAGSWLVLTVMTQPLGAAKPTGMIVQPAGKAPELTVEGRWQATLQDAQLSAETQAYGELRDYFQQRGVEDVPPMSELRPLLTRYWKLEPEDKDFPDGVGRMHRFVLTIPVTPDLESFVVKQGRVLRAQERMLWLGKILAGLVLVLTVVAGYLYFDEWTKGYYSMQLRLAAVSFMVLLVIVFLWAWRAPMPPMPSLP
jgi:hypothetical protein